eukprot:3809725-Rhodomonas_salina.1
MSANSANHPPPSSALLCSSFTSAAAAAPPSLTHSCCAAGRCALPYLRHALTISRSSRLYLIGSCSVRT